MLWTQYYSPLYLLAEVKDLLHSEAAAGIGALEEAWWVGGHHLLWTGREQGQHSVVAVLVLPITRQCPLASRILLWWYSVLPPRASQKVSGSLSSWIF